MKTKINPENIQTVGELIKFLKTTNSFCVKGKLKAIEFFSKYNRNELIDNIENIPDEWVYNFCKEIKGKTIDKFRNKIKDSKYAYFWAKEFRGKEIELMRDRIKESYYAYIWARTFEGKEIELMRDRINNEEIAFEWAKEFKGEEIKYMRDKINSSEIAFKWAKEFRGEEIDLMLNKIEDEYYKEKVRLLKKNNVNWYNIASCVSEK